MWQSVVGLLTPLSGDPVFNEGCASNIWSFSSTCSWSCTLYEPRYDLPKKSTWVCLNSHHKLKLVVSVSKFIGLFFPNVRKIAVDQLVFRFWISPSISETFSVIFKSCPKSGQILHVLASYFWREGFKLLDLHCNIHYYSACWRLWVWQSFTAIGQGRSKISSWKK